MSARPEIKSHSIGPRDNAVYKISKGCDILLPRKLLPKFPIVDH
jgi:hypothetical protein